MLMQELPDNEMLMRPKVDRAAPRPPRRSAVAAPPAVADPTPWQQVLELAPQDAAACQALMALTRRRTVKVGHWVIEPGGVAQNLVLLLSGRIALGTATGSGTLRSERGVNAPAWLDATSAWLGVPHDMHAQALSDVVVADVPVEPLRALVRTHPVLAERFIVALARQVHELTESARSLMTHDAPQRLAAWLVQHCEASGGRAGGEAVVRLSERKRDLASQLGVTPETLSRLLRSLSRKGVIDVAGYDVRVLEMSALTELAGLGADPPA
jgi:CRP-like cAMP-binding protein